MTHILWENLTPPESAVLLMACGSILVLQDDGSRVPSADFVLPEVGHLSDCPRCRRIPLAIHLGLLVVEEPIEVDRLDDGGDSDGDAPDGRRS